jgi:uncharacterized membrane protein (TIGR02234 family)
MSLAQRGRTITLLGFVIAGGIGVISSTQTWFTVERTDAGADILVPGASALVLLAPLSLAVLALGAALSIAGRALRVVLSALAAAAAVFLGWSTLQLLISEPLGAIGPAVTDATGLAGDAAVDAVVASVAPTGWPVLALVGWAVLLATAVFALSTWRRWKVGGRRYRTAEHAPARGDGPVDAIDSWDDLSRGTDPTR